MRSFLGDVGGIAALIVGFAGLLTSLAFLKRHEVLDPEWARKIFHIGAGVMALMLPVLFDSAEPVLAVAVVIGLALATLRWVKPVRRGPGEVLHGVDRRSLGELYFLGAVVVLFALVGRDGPVYAVPIAVLTIADPAAALIGGRFGSHRFKVLGGHKSVEGSLAFSVASGLAALPLLVSGTDLFRAVVIAAIISGTLTIVEATAGGGLDNVLIPAVGTAVLLVADQLSSDQLIAGGLAVAGAAAVALVSALTVLRVAQEVRP